MTGTTDLTESPASAEPLPDRGDQPSQAIPDSAPNRFWLLWTPLLLGGGLFYRLHNLWGADLKQTDERVNVRFAQEIASGGLSALRSLLVRFPTDQNLKYEPPPLRLAYTLPTALLTHWFGPGPVPLVWLSWAAGLGCLALAWALFRRWLSPWAAVAATAFVALSPLGTSLSRVALQDTYFACLVLALIFLVERITVEKRRLDPFLLGLCAFLGLLTKEHMVVIFALAAASLLGQPLRIWMRVLIPLTIGGIAAVLVAAVFAGGLTGMFDVYRVSWAMTADNFYINRYQRGPVYRYAVDLLLISPAVFLLGFYGLGAGLNERGPRRCALWALGGIVVYGSLPVLNVRFILFAEQLWCGLAGIGLVALAGRLVRPERKLLVFGLLGIALLGTEIFQFHQLFPNAALTINDPITDALVKVDGLVRP